MVEPVSVQNRVREALPTHVRWVVHGTPLDFDFSRALVPLRPPDHSDLSGPLEPGWASLLPFGEQVIADGGGASPLIALDPDTGAVNGLDPERGGEAVFLFSTSLDAFIATFRLFDGVIRAGTVPLSSLASAALAIDPAFPRTEWAQLHEFLLNG